MIKRLWREFLCLCGKHTFVYDEQAKSDSMLRSRYWEGKCCCGKVNRIPFLDPFVR